MAGTSARLKADAFGGRGGRRAEGIFAARLLNFDMSNKTARDDTRLLIALEDENMGLMGRGRKDIKLPLHRHALETGTHFAFLCFEPTQPRHDSSSY
jgi:hypothetical protein